MKQQMNSDDTSDFFGGSLPAIQFPTVGTRVVGLVISKDRRQITDFKTGEPQFWKDGRPKWQIVVTLQTEKPTADDPKTSALYVRGQLQKAFVDAVKAARLRDLTVGTWVAVTFTEETEPPKEGMNPGKIYQVEILTAAEGVRQAEELAMSRPAGWGDGAPSELPF